MEGSIAAGVSAAVRLSDSDYRDPTTFLALKTIGGQIKVSVDPVSWLPSPLATTSP